MASAVSAIFILDLKGKVLISRNYRGDIPMSAVEKFLPLVLEAEEDSQAPAPCFTDDGINYLYIRHNNLFLLAITRKNSNATTVMLFLHTIAEVLTEYFKELEEESIRDNFVIIYELLDEMMDFGYPQTTESKILQEYITQDAYKLEVQVRPPMAVTNAVSWRSEGIRYRKNEVFLDVVESVNLLVNANGNVLRSEILGAVKMKVFLSGMPELRLGLNDKARAQFKRRSSANNVEIHIPVPEDADSPKFRSGIGSVQYVPEKACVIWKIKQFQGGKEFSMRAHFGLPSVKNLEDADKKPPMSIKFEIPYFTTSGIQVRYLKIQERSGYAALPWVRYITQNGDYQMRMPDSIKAAKMAPI
ncbi:hypothetical protein BGZ90_006018 [Linnemannia elongata]|nr:hypothetical protein BGZ90_006018 [Linnemannia elongata]